MTASDEQAAAIARLTGAFDRQADELRQVRSSLGLETREEMRLLRPDDVAARLGKSRAWVYRNQHVLGGFRVGGQVRFDPEHLDAYLERCRRGTGAETRPADNPSTPLLPLRPSRRVGRVENPPPRTR